MSCDNKYTLTGPCKDCPFRAADGGLRGLRPERIQSIRMGQTFHCHNTVDYDDEGGHNTSASRVCGGWLAMCWKLDHGFSGLAAMVARAGLFNPDDLRVDDVFDSWAECVQAHQFRSHR